MSLTELPNIVNCLLEPKHIRRMDFAEERKRRCDDESDQVTERTIIWRILTLVLCRGEERWPISLCFSEGDIVLCLLLNVSLRPKNKVADFNFDLQTEFKTPNLAPSSNRVALRDAESNVE